MATRERIADTAERVSGPEAVVLETKLARPPRRPEHLQRPGLLATLLAPGARKLTLVAAPPGFGKTTLLAEWAATEGAPVVAWLSLDETDNDPTRFFTYVGAALQRVAPELGTGALTALRNPGADVLAVVLPQFLNDLATLDRELVLVVEDYHVIVSAEVHRIVEYLVERSPSTLRLVLSTRHDPPLPLGRLRARGDLTEVRASDLRFGDEETAAFLVDRLGLELSAHDIARLQARTEGWPAAVYLAALSLQGRSDASALVEQFAGDDRYVVDYLTSEVLARQTPELRSFLLRTSILGRFNGPLCDAVAEVEGSTQRLVELERSNLFLVPLDTRREWYRYHHLFGDLLRHELETTRRDTLPDLHRRASAWLREAGLIVDAVRHAVAGGDLDAVAQLIGRHYGLFVDGGQLATVTGWLELMPEAAIERDWLLGFAGAVVYAHAGRLDAAERCIRLAERAPQVMRDGQEPAGPLAAITGAVHLLRGDIGGAVAHSRRALAAPLADDPMWAFGQRMVLASGLWWSDRPREALEVLEVASRSATEAGVAANIVYALGLRAAIALDQQDEPAAAALAGEAIRLVDSASLEEHPWAAMAFITQGLLSSRNGDITPGEEAVEHGLSLGERMQAWQVMSHGCLALAEIRQQQHDAPGARRLLARAREILSAVPDPGDGLARLERAEKALRLRANRNPRATGAPFWELSQREMEVLRLLPSPLSQREIAAELYVSFNTVRTHTRVIFNKLGVSSRAEAVARARELGLI